MKRRTIKLVLNAIIIALLLAGAAYVCSRFVHLGRVEFTDNAMVRQHITPVNTRVPGFIREIRFEEYQPVRKGDTLLIIEDTEFRLRVAQAEADLAAALAGKNATGAGIATMTNNLSVGDATIEEARVQRENARRELERYEGLLKKEAVTRQQYDNVKTAYESAAARYEQVARARHSTSLSVGEQQHRLSQGEALITVCERALDLARLNLGYTVIVATADGVLGAKDIHEGQLVQPGQTMVEIVDGTDTWVVANYRESQLSNISVGAKVDIRADAVPDVRFEGVVEVISNATGAAFSMIPQDNATGNFVKIEQRVPVRIRFAEGTPAEDLERLRAGLNVECEVRY